MVVVAVVAVVVVAMVIVVVVVMVVVVAVVVLVVRILLAVAIYRDQNKVAKVTLLLPDDGNSTTCQVVYLVHFRGWTSSSVLFLE